MLAFGVVFVVAGLAFKLGVVPFHMWVPDVYQGAPTAVTLLIGGAPKLAAFAITIRLLVEGMSGLAVDWQQMLIVLAVASMVLGNLAAIAQSNLKRMLAYSTIAQMGFMLLGMTRGRGQRQHAVGRQRLQLGDVLRRHLRAHHARHLRHDHVPVARRVSRARRSTTWPAWRSAAPGCAGVMTVFMFSLAGVPPMVGFYAKLAMLQALVSTNLTAYIVAGGDGGAAVADRRLSTTCVSSR